MRYTLTLLMLGLPVLALADVRFASGGPRRPNHRDAAVAAVKAAAADMGPCWRGAPPPEVEVTLSVGAQGEIVSARQKTAGAAAQCVAGLLAVATLPATGEAWTAVVAVPAGRAGGGGLEAEITSQLGDHRVTLAGCQSGDPASAGQIEVALVIAPGGAITPTVTQATVSDAIAICVTDALRRITLALSERKPFRYRLSLQFAGGAVAGGGAKGKPPASPPAVAGPDDGAMIKAGSSLGPDVVQGAMMAASPDIKRCAQGSKGRVMVGFTIRADGTVKNVGIKSSTLGNAKAEACIVARIEKLRFPTSEGETRLTYPFTFR